MLQAEWMQILQMEICFEIIKSKQVNDTKGEKNPRNRKQECNWRQWVTFLGSQSFYLEIYEFCTWRSQHSPCIVSQPQFLFCIKGRGTQHWLISLLLVLPLATLEPLLKPVWEQTPGTPGFSLNSSLPSPLCRFSLTALSISPQDVLGAWLFLLTGKRIKSLFSLDLWCPGQSTAHQGQLFQAVLLPRNTWELLL